MGSMSIVHWMIVFGVVVLLFGRHKISDLMGDVAQGIKSFRKGMAEDGPATVKPNETPPDNRGARSMVAAPLPDRVGDKV